MKEYPRHAHDTRTDEQKFLDLERRVKDLEDWADSHVLETHSQPRPQGTEQTA